MAPTWLAAEAFLEIASFGLFHLFCCCCHLFKFSRSGPSSEYVTVPDPASGAAVWAIGCSALVSWQIPLVADHVFVYGSLQRGLLHHDQMSGALFVKDDQLEGHFLVLYEGGYPALVAGDSMPPVRGEVYEVSGDHLARLDEFEECPELYSRSRVTLRSGGTAWAYMIGKKEASRFPRIEGKWEASSVL